ncbi:neural proliferation differentiation and control protein 1-like [Emydura macquarii macquarii]|uniref:neural proliferation differentiation and control protein 1-like n=1 Tax=Emydura macquarii macquarii TaxID=1129001 RepID=UPI00352B2AF4
MRTLRWLAALAALLGMGLAPGAGGEAGPSPTCPARIRLNCLLRRRQGCGPGGTRTCGPCLGPYREDPRGDCVLKKPPRRDEGAELQAGPSDLAGLIRTLLARNQKGSATPRTETPQHAVSVGFDPQVPSVTQTPPAPPTTPPPSARARTPGSDPPRPAGPAEEDLNSGPPPRLSEAASLLLVLVCSVTGVSGLLVAALCWYRLQREVRLAQKMAYTAYRGTHYRYHQPGMYMDTRLAQACQIHQYQHQKKILTNEESPRSSPKPVQQLSTESENETGDYTVYECPGLAPSGEMEIHNPLFNTAPARQRCLP